MDSRSRLYYVHAGHGTVVHHSRRFVLEPGMLYLIPSNTSHDHACESLDISWCHFTAIFHTGVSFFSIFEPEYVLSARNIPRVDEMFQELIENFKTDSVPSIVARTGILMQLLSPFLSGISSKSFNMHMQRAERFEQALNHIENNIGSDLRIDDLAKLCAMSNSCFSREFSKIFGTPPAKYITQRRIENGQLRLLQTQDTVETIGISLGFCDGFHFSKSFRKIVGLSPGRYRKLCRIP
jgi:AraC-like DNA-binding protein